MGKQAFDHTGQRYGRLVASHRVPDPGKNAIWRCICDCGADTNVSACHLVSGHTQSCGCRLRDIVTRHGMTGTRTYKTWDMMLQRTGNQNHDNYHYYGGRGIKVCKRWRVFNNFLADMGERPEGMTLDRIDPDGDYEPGNCRWATLKEQANNKRKHRVDA